jgi:phage tail-like protein
MADEYYPPGAFYFAVDVLGVGTALTALTGFAAIDASFQEVSGFQAEFGVEEVAEGGENRFVHRLPLPAKYSNLVLKRGVVTKESILAEWFGQTVGSGLSLPIVTQNVLVRLLAPEGNIPLIAWIFVNAWPVRWDVGPLDSMDNKILTETLELSYNYFERFNLGSGLSAAVKMTEAVARMRRSR